MAQARDNVGKFNNRRFQTCPFAEEKCSKCGGTGHIARACKGLPPPQNQKQQVAGLHHNRNIVSRTGYGRGHGTYFDDKAMPEKELVLDAYCEPQETGKQCLVNPQKGETACANKITDTTTTPTATLSSGEPVDPEPHRIRLLSWNTDGIDENDVETRAKAVAKIIAVENPDVVFLQEVVEETAEIYEEHCPQYEFVPGGRENYFVVMLLRVSSVVLKSASIIPFHSTRMGRNLLTAKVTVKGVEMELLTSHLESMTAHSDERKRQLQKAFEEMKSAPPESTVIFGGDLNLRDKEVAALGGLPEGVCDLWEVSGKCHDTRYTWDTQKNDNLDADWEFKPRLRFDRLYLRHPLSGPNKLKPVCFELVGIQRLTSCKRFPSDHWGILSHYDKVKS